MRKPIVTPRPTTKDLATAAGVSLATVDRVLNGRLGVSPEKTEAVQAAIQRIGFQRNLVAATLARQRGYRFAFLLPETNSEFLDTILERIAEYRSASLAEMIEIRVIRLDTGHPHDAARLMAGLSLQECDGVAIMAPETPQIRDALRRMRERGIHTVAFVATQGPSPDQPFVGIDNAAAGASAARLMRRFLGARGGSILVMADSMQARDSLERRHGFDRVIDGSHLVRPTLETHGDPGRTARVLQTACTAFPDVTGLYLMGMEARQALEALDSMASLPELVVIAHERTPSTETALRSGRLDAVIHQDPGHLVRSAIRTLRAQCDNREPLASQERIRVEILIAENL